MEVKNVTTKKYVITDGNFTNEYEIVYSTDHKNGIITSTPLLYLIKEDNRRGFLLSSTKVDELYNQFMEQVDKLKEKLEILEDMQFNQIVEYKELEILRYD